MLTHMAFALVTQPERGKRQSREREREREREM